MREDTIRVMGREIGEKGRERKNKGEKRKGREGKGKGVKGRAHEHTGTQIIDYARIHHLVYAIK